jgi:hypothetical protein
MLQLFKKYIIDIDRRDLLNILNAYIDAKQYLEHLDLVKKNSLAVSFNKLA